VVIHANSYFTIFDKKNNIQEVGVSLLIYKGRGHPIIVPSLIVRITNNSPATALRFITRSSPRNT